MTVDKIIHMAFPISTTKRQAICLNKSNTDGRDEFENDMLETTWKWK